MEKRKRFVINFLYYTLILLTAFVLIKYGVPLVAPFLIGFLIAYFLRRPIRFFSVKCHIPWKAAAVALVLVFYAIIGTLVALLGIKLISSGGALIRNLPTLFRSQVVPVLSGIFTDLESAVTKMEPDIMYALDYVWAQLMQSLGQMVSSLSVSSMEFLSGIASSLPMLFIKLLLMVISSFFIAADYDRLRNFCMRQLDGRTKDIFWQVKQYVVGTLFVCIRSYLLIMSITFVELSLGLSVIGVKNAFLIAFCIAVFDILPVLGTGGIMIPWALITALQGDYAMAVKLFVIYLIITVIRNIIEPKIVGSQIGLHPVVTLVSMFAGAQLLGIIGLFGFPILLSLLRYLNESGTVRIYKEG